MPLPKAMEKIEDFLKKHPVVHAFWGFLFGWNVGAIVLGISNAIDIEPNNKIWLWPVKPAAQKHPLKHPLNILFLPLMVPGIFLFLPTLWVTALSVAAFHLVKKGIQKMSRKSKKSAENTEKYNEFNQTNRDPLLSKETKPPVTPSFKSSSPPSSSSSLPKYPKLTKAIEGIFSDKNATEEVQLALLKDIKEKYTLVSIKESITELYTTDSPVADKLWILLEGQNENSEFKDSLYRHVSRLNTIKKMFEITLPGGDFKQLFFFNTPDNQMIIARAIVRFLNDSSVSQKVKDDLQSAINFQDAQRPNTTPSWRELVERFSSEQSSRSHHSPHK